MIDRPAFRRVSVADARAAGRHRSSDVLRDLQPLPHLAPLPRRQARVSSTGPARAVGGS